MLTEAFIHLLRRKAKETRNLVDKAVLGWYYNQASTGKRLREWSLKTEQETSISNFGINKKK